MFLGIGLGIKRFSAVLTSIVSSNLQMWLGFTKADVLGAELVVDGDFPTGTTAWTFGSGWSLGTDKADATDADFSSSFTQSNAIAIVAGTEYQLSFDISNYVKGNIRIGVGNTWSNTFSSNDRFTVVLTASNTNSLKIETRAGGGGTTLSISNITVKKAGQFAPDASTNTNNAKLFTGKALEFNGNDSVDIDFGDPNINLKSICFWIKLDATNTTEQIANLTSTHNITSVSGTITLNGTWSNANIYVNGVDTDAIGTTYKRVVITTDTNILVDEFDLAKIDSDYGLITIADIQIYDAQLTLADALIDYNNPNDLVFNKGGSVALANLVGYWALSEGSGSIAYDSSGGGNNGTISGATYDDQQPTIPQLGMMDWSNASGKTLIEAPNNIGYDILGNALRLREGGFNLDGSGYAEVADSTSLNITTAITLAAWVKWSDVNDKGLVTRWTDTKKGFMLYKKTTGFAMYIGATFLNSSTITGSDWVYVVGTYDGTNIKTYIDGSPDNTLAHTGVIPYHSYTVDVGRYGDSSSSYNNLIDDVLIYDEALTATEILNNYNVGLVAHPAPAFTGLLDTYSGAAVGYSLRRLRTAYSGNCVKVRRASDSTELDIGFVNNVLDTASLATFCSGTDGFVTTWYDQSGSSNNATQTAGANQPKIVSGGVVELENGLPALKFGGAKRLRVTYASSITPVTASMVINSGVTTGKKAFGDDLSVTNNNSIWRQSADIMRLYGSATALLHTSASGVLDSQILLSFISDGASSKLGVNNVFTTGTLPTISMAGNSIGADGTSTSYWIGTIQEVIVYGANKSSDLAGIETNINTNYSIY